MISRSFTLLIGRVGGKWSRVGGKAGEVGGKRARVGGKVDQVGGKPIHVTVTYNFIPYKRALQKVKFPSAALRYFIEVYVMLLGLHYL